MVLVVVFVLAYLLGGMAALGIVCVNFIAGANERAQEALLWNDHQ